MLLKLGCIWKLLFILMQCQSLRFASEILEKMGNDRGNLPENRYLKTRSQKEVRTKKEKWSQFPRFI